MFATGRGVCLWRSRGVVGARPYLDWRWVRGSGRKSHPQRRRLPLERNQLQILLDKSILNSSSSGNLCELSLLEMALDQASPRQMILQSTILQKATSLGMVVDKLTPYPSHKSLFRKLHSLRFARQAT